MVAVTYTDAVENELRPEGMRKEKRAEVLLVKVPSRMIISFESLRIPVQESIVMLPDRC